MDSRSSIGIFDSGIGGLAVVNTISRVLEQENLMYIADSKNFPYGTKTKNQIAQFSERITRLLLKKDVKAIIVACNTVSSIAMPLLKEISYPVPVFGMIQSGAILAVKTTKNKKIGVISTPLTAASHAYKKEIRKLDDSIEVFEIGSQRMVNLVENGNKTRERAYELVKGKLQSVISAKIDTLVLGCTHFPFLDKVVKNVVGKDVKVVDPADELVLKLGEFLKLNNLINKSLGINTRKFFTTGRKEEFLIKAKLFLDDFPKEVHKLDV
ncbi:MAG: glutamate racemase [Caldisericaceae bacterium]|nr:glutamate racemase [Caldisericaceae bacterium]